MARFLADAGADVITVDLRIAEKDTRDQFAAYERALAHPPDQIRVTLDRMDPDGTALVYAGSFTTATNMCGRQMIGARSPNHLDAERKDRQNTLLGRGGQIVSLAEGLEHVDVPAVVQGIPDDFVAMATSHTYFLPRSANSSQVRRLTETLNRDCSMAVVTPFNPGLPCTIYGFITSTKIVDFGAVEALLSWDRRTWRIYATGILRPLSAPMGVVVSARDRTHVIAQRLHDQYDYRGAFGTDGIITDSFYNIHEINPRVCAGFGLFDQIVPEAAPLAAVDLLLRELPGASAALTAPLEALATFLQRTPMRAYRLWECPTHDITTAGGETDGKEWARRVREMATDNRRPICELMAGDS